MQQRKIGQYGWKPDFPDFRDIYYRDVHSPDALQKIVVNPNINAIVHQVTAPVGVGVNLLTNPNMPSVLDQTTLGSCTANAGATLFSFVFGTDIRSRLQLYYNERAIEGTINTDSGAQIRDVIRVMVQVGAGSEKLWPYDVSKFADAPPPVELADAALHKDTVYSRLVSRQDFRNCLDQGFPFIIGFTVYSSFESQAVAASGVVPMPTMQDQCIGGHAVCVIGYNTNIYGGDYYLIRNSWGPNWGDHGNFWMPAAYLENENLACDAWTIRKS